MVVTNNGGCNTVGKGRRGVDGKEEQNLAVIKLVDLVAQHSCLPIVVCRSTCDDLDSLCSFLSALPFFSSSTLVSLKLIFFLIISPIFPYIPHLFPDVSKFLIAQTPLLSLLISGIIQHRSGWYSWKMWGIFHDQEGHFIETRFINHTYILMQQKLMLVKKDVFKGKKQHNDTSF